MEVLAVRLLLFHVCPLGLNYDSLLWHLPPPMFGASTVKSFGGPEGFTMGDTSVRRPVASHFEKRVDFQLTIHKSPLMVEHKDPLVLSNYIFGLLEVSIEVARFLSSCIPGTWRQWWSRSQPTPRRVRG